jgi:hypothetical protein
MNDLQKSTVATSISILKDNLKGIKKQMLQARESDNNEEYIELQERLNKTQMDLVALESWKPEEIEEPKEDKTPKTKSLEEAPQSVRDWANKNTWFKNPATPEDRKRQREAVTYSETLIMEGYDIESPEFFKMIDDRLVKLGLAKEDKTSVKSKSKDKDSSEGRKKAKISQTVQGASRTPASRKKSKNKVTLTPEQQKIAELYGMTHLEYAKELLEIEKSEKAGKRMTTLKI